MNSMDHGLSSAFLDQSFIIFRNEYSSAFILPAKGSAACHVSGGESEVCDKVTAQVCGLGVMEAEVYIMQVGMRVWIARVLYARVHGLGVSNGDDREGKGSPISHADRGPENR